MNAITDRASEIAEMLISNASARCDNRISDGYFREEQTLLWKEAGSDSRLHATVLAIIDASSPPQSRVFWYEFEAAEG